MADRAPNQTRAPLALRPFVSAIGRLVAVLLLATRPAGSARAEVPSAPCTEASPADHWVRERFAAFVSVWRDRLPGPAGDGRISRQLVSFFSAHADFTDFSRRVLGPSWELAEDAQRGRWTALLRAGLERRYLDQVRSPLGATLSVEAIRGDCDETVVTVGLRHRLQRETRTVELVLRWDGASWRAADAIVDEASLLEHYRARFRRIHSAGGVEAVDTYLVSFGAPPQGD
jgi:ABC-type transporter MlaC component